MNEVIYDRKTFEAADGRRSSPEWDFGVHWIRDERMPFPRYRVSWIVETGELYAVAQTGAAAEVLVLATIPKVGEYPYPSDRAGGYSSGEAWTRFKNEQTVERIMDGWAEGGPKTLDWIRERLP